MKRILLTVAAAAALIMAAGAHAQDHHAGASSATPASAAESLNAAHHKMMRDMDIRPTGDADRDFVLMMIPHHQGAIDMAKAQLDHGKDHEIRKLAEEIIAAQEKEIRQMKDWLEAHPAPVR